MGTGPVLQKVTMRTTGKAICKVSPCSQCDHENYTMAQVPERRSEQMPVQDQLTLLEDAED